MRFGSVPLAEAAGAILGHNIADDAGRRLLRKGTVLGAEDLAVLAASGRTHVWVAQPDNDDVGEDEAAERLAAAAAGPGVRRSGGRTGRVNLYAEHAGVLRVMRDRLDTLNDHDGLTLATLRHQAAVPAGKMVATLKVIPYAVPAAVVASALRELATPLLSVAPPIRQRCGLVLSGSPGARERVEPGFRGALDNRLAVLGAHIAAVAFVSLDDEDAVERLATALDDQRRDGVELIILAGETAIMDVRDIAPRALEAAGGTVTAFGAPVDPGNLLMLGELGDVTVVGAPGCARSPKTNVVDRVLPRLLVGDRLGRRDLVSLGHGGLLEDVPERRMPRSWVT